MGFTTRNMATIAIATAIKGDHGESSAPTRQEAANLATIDRINITMTANAVPYSIAIGISIPVKKYDASGSLASLSILRSHT